MMYLTRPERAGVAGEFARPDWTLGQNAFRDAIMDEYKFELVGEGYDGFHARRRGYNISENTIKRNNDPTKAAQTFLFIRRFAAMGYSVFNG